MVLLILASSIALFSQLLFMRKWELGGGGGAGSRREMQREYARLGRSTNTAVYVRQFKASRLGEAGTVWGSLKTSYAELLSPTNR